MAHNVGIALLLTAGAGLSTTIGSVLGLAVRKPGQRFMGFTLGFSAGVMILVSFVELLQGSIHSIGFLAAHFGFFIGMASIFLIDLLVPHKYIGQDDHKMEQSEGGLMRVGLLVAFGIGIHNFPEGMATFAGALQDVRLGIAIAVAIALKLKRKTSNVERKTSEQSPSGWKFSGRHTQLMRSRAVKGRR